MYLIPFDTPMALPRGYLLCGMYI